VNLPNLVGTVVDYLAALSGIDQSSIRIVVVVITGTTTLWILARLIMSLIKKIAPVGAGMIDAAARYSNTRGRNRSRNKLCAAVADKGSPQDMLQALQEINQVSPMDAPESNMYLGTQPYAAVPAHRATPLSEAAEATVVITPTRAQLQVATVERT
jgi:hypothetical protein